MKKINLLKLKILIMLFIITGITQVIISGPYAAFCINFNCQYFHAAPQYGLCTDGTKDLYATAPDVFIPCYGTRQWYGFLYGWHSHGTMFHQGWYTTAIEGATNNVYTVTERGKYWCTVDCGDVPFNTDTIEFFYDSDDPFINFDPQDKTTCEGNEVSFNVTASTSSNYMRYVWEKMMPGGSYTTISKANSATYSYTPLIDDNLSKFRCLVSNGCGSVYSAGATLTVNPLPSVDLGADQHLCPGSSVELDAGSGLQSYLWSTTETTQKINVTSGGTYSVAVTTQLGCEGSGSVNVIMDPSIPELDLGNDVTICPEESTILDASNQYTTYSWSTGSIANHITVSEAGTYSVTVSRTNSVCSESDEINVFIAEPFDEEVICVVTVDIETGKNLIVWERTPDVGVINYNIYRESDVSGVYNKIGSLPAETLSIFLDEDSHPEEQQYLYKISAVDNCGSESDLSVYHKTLFLQYIGSVNGVNMRWDKYEVEGVPYNFDSYIIYRGTDSSKLAEVKTISGSLTSWNDTDPEATSKRQYYRIGGIIGEVCSPANLKGKKADSGPYSQSMSNIEDNRLQTGLNNLKSGGELAIYPNPSADYTNICFSNPEQNEYQLIVRDLTGKMVLFLSNITEDKVTIGRGNLKAGYYSVEVLGEYIYRGKLILE